MISRKEPTHTSLVDELLRKADDFLSAKQVRAETGLKAEQVHVALHELQRYKAADSVLSEGRLFWYSTPGTDTRIRVVEQRTPEVNKRRPKRVKEKRDV